MTRLIKRKWLVILKARKLFIYRAIIPTIFIDDDVWTLCVKLEPQWGRIPRETKKGKKKRMDGCSLKNLFTQTNF